MGDDFPCKHRASTNEYRDGWDIIWGKKTPEILGVDEGRVGSDKSNVKDVSFDEIVEIVDRHKNKDVWEKMELIQFLPINPILNQCDGCNAGYPINENGLHVIPYPSGTTVCQKHKYQKDAKVSREELFAILDKAY